MRVYVSPAFWSDPDVENASPEIKLTALWLMTNSQTTLIGTCAATERRFAFETGLPAEGLPRACQALPNTFKVVAGTIFIRNFIRHQFGTGDALRRNNFFRAMIPIFEAVKDTELRKCILADYPEFEGASGSPWQGVPKGSTRGGVPQERRGEVQRGTDGVGSPEGRGARPTLTQAMAAANQVGVTEVEADAWWQAREGTDWFKGTAGGGSLPVGANWRADLKSYTNSARERRATRQGGGNGQRDAKGQRAGEITTDVNASKPRSL